MPTSPAKREYQRQRMNRLYTEDPQRVLAIQHAGGLPCRGCGRLRKVSQKDRERTIAAGGPLCHDCRRAERERLAELESRIRAERIAGTPVRFGRRNPRKGSGRSGTGDSAYRRARVEVLSNSDVCGICGHHGSATVDHIVSHRRWPRDLCGELIPGFNAVANLQPAHGTLGKSGLVNRCPVCGKLCNQVKGSR
jgi:hypothetical protein